MSDSVLCFGPEFWLEGGCRRALQAAVDPLDGVAFVLGDDALLDVGFNLLVHEVLQLGQVIICKMGDNKCTGKIMRLQRLAV